MKNKNKDNNRKCKITDETISRLLQTVRYDIPPALEDRLDFTIVGWEKREQKKITRRRFFVWYPAAAVLTASVLIAALFIFKPFAGDSSAPAALSEIRTEFELKDKNIKIIWFQKKDFELRRQQS